MACIFVTYSRPSFCIYCLIVHIMYALCGNELSWLEHRVGLLCFGG